MVICGPSCLYTIFFPTLSFKQHDFRIKVIDPMACVNILCTAFAGNISHSKNNSARYYHKCTYVFMYRTHYSCQILTRLEFSWQIFEKYCNMKFHDNPSSGSRAFPCGHTDRQSMTTLIVASRSFANAPKNIVYRAKIVCSLLAPLH